MLTDLLIVALSSAFVVSFVERWIDHPLVRGGVALVMSVAGMLVLDYSGMRLAVVSTAAAFGTLIAILVGERLATPPPIAVDPRRR